MNNLIVSVCCLTVFLLSAVTPSLAQEAVHLSKSEAGKFFPKELVGYKLKDLKIKKKSETWAEYSATYKTSKKGDKELKLVINDVFPIGAPEWKDQFSGSKDSISSFPAKEVAGDDKHTVMVLVGERFRVDFKSRQISPEKLRTMAEAFNFDPVASVAK